MRLEKESLVLHKQYFSILLEVLNFLDDDLSTAAYRDGINTAYESTEYLLRHCGEEVLPDGRLDANNHIQNGFDLAKSVFIKLQEGAQRNPDKPFWEELNTLLERINELQSQILQEGQ